MSKFTHSICDECWQKRNPDLEPYRLVGEYRHQDRCCYCSRVHGSGIYVRDHPADMPCNGVHEGGEQHERQV